VIGDISNKISCFLFAYGSGGKVLSQTQTHTAQINEKRLVADICGKRALLFDRKKGV
jgi:3-oxoacyl-[acyl-carrier-protein] synthase III